MAWLGHQEKVTWEPASAFPTAVIQEFESSDACTQEITTDSSFGVINHTVVVTKLDQTKPPPAKRARMSASKDLGNVLDVDFP